MVLNVAIQQDDTAEDADAQMGTLDHMYYEIIEKLMSRVYLKLCHVYEQAFQENFGQDEIDVVEFNYNWKYEEIAQKVIDVMKIQRGYELEWDKIQFFNSEYNRVTFSSYFKNKEADSEGKFCWLEQLITKKSHYINFMTLEDELPFNMSDKYGLLQFVVSTGALIEKCKSENGPRL